LGAGRCRAGVGDMSELSDFLGPGLEVLEGVCGAVVTWGGRDYPVVPGSALRGKDLGPGGFRWRSDFTFFARPGVFPAPGPQLKERVVYEGEEYRIDGIERGPGGAFARYDCNDPNQGA